MFHFISTLRYGSARLAASQHYSIACGDNNILCHALKQSLLIILTLFSFFASSAQRIATLQITTTGKEAFSIPVQISLDEMSLLPDSSLQLSEIKNNKKQPIAFQTEAVGGTRILHWLVTPSSSTIRTYELEQSPVPFKAGPMQVEEDEGSLVISDDARHLLRYHFKTVYPPKGVDTAFRRSGFIHPLNTPAGHSLTRINAPDHYHHWGMWNPWTRVLFEKDTVDFWNLKDRKGTVQFSGFTSIEKGNAYAGFSALHEHVAFKKDGTQKIAINELQTVRIYHSSSSRDYYILDITSRLSCAGTSPVLLLEYRYGGLGIRATEEWNKDNSSTLTSEGKNRKEADGSLARWCTVQGRLGNGRGGLQMMSHPANFNHPEPLRIWPENSNGRGDVFLNFSPTKNTNWLLQPGKTYVLKYRFLVFNNSLSKKDAEQAWQAFAHPPKVHVVREKNES